MRNLLIPRETSFYKRFSLAASLVVSFGLLYAILTAIGAVSFFSLRSIEKLNAAERSINVDEIEILELIGKQVGLEQAEVFRHVAATNSQEMDHHEQVIARLTERNANDFAGYKKNVDNEAEARLYADVLRARKAYTDRTSQLLALSRGQQKSEGAAFALATQVPAYDLYQLSLEKVLNFESAEQRGIAADTTGLIEQTRLVEDILIGLAIVILLGTGVAVTRMVRRLKQDKNQLQTKVVEHERAEKALREAEEKYRSIFNNASEGIFQNTPEGVLISANPALARMLGFDSPEQLIRERNDVERQGYVEPAKRAEFKRLLEEKGVVENFEYEVKRKDGSNVWVSENVRMVRDPAGHPLYYEGSAQDITERRQGQAASILLTAIVESSDAGIIGKDLNSIVTSWNKGAEKIFGYTAGEMIGTSIIRLIPADRREEENHILAKIKCGESLEHFETVRQVKGGELIDVSLTASPIKDVGGRIIGVSKIARDITEEKQAQHALRESDEKFNQLVDHITDVFWITSSDLKIMHYVSAGYELIWGRPKETLYANPHQWIETILEEDRERVFEIFGALMGNEPQVSAEYRIARPDGAIRWIHDRGFQVRDAAGNLVRLTGIATDITDQKQVGQRLVEQADLLNLAQDAIMVRGMDDRIEFWNHGAEVLYGWTAEEARGQLSVAFLHYEENVKILAERVLLETGAWSGDCRHLTKAGNSVIVRSRWTLVRDEHGQPKSKLVIATDMTEQKKIEEQFLRAQRLESIGTLASGVAHDLNNILVPIMMAAPVLRGEMEPAEREKFLDIVETSAHRGADIIKQVLTFARGADGDRILLQPIYLLEEVSKIASQTFPKSIGLRTCNDENIHSLEADPTQLHQVLLNLCINARDAMPDGGELCLGAENFDVDEPYASMTPGATVGPHVMLQVTDTGSGIPKQVLDKIFDPFFTTKTIGKGTGLGLSTVAGIVKSHGGFISVESRPGHTSFKIFLPAKATVDNSSALQTDTMIPRGHGETILLVDDEPSIREVAEVILKSHGYKALVAEDGPSALAFFARQRDRIAVVVTDLSMPGMGGLMLVRTLRQIEPGLKIILSTGGADEANTAEITALNVDGVLTKPYAGRNLLLKLSHVLHSEMQDAA